MTEVAILRLGESPSGNRHTAETNDARSCADVDIGDPGTERRTADRAVATS